ncbi:hypothetical protein J0670_17645 [Streptomyces sp. FH025]|nr:hypothetical protein [Streptomyces sp. FH025]
MVLGALAAGALIAPVAFHRFLAGHQMMPELVRAGAKLVTLGLVLLGVTVGAALALLLHVATGSPLARVVAGAVVLWFTVCWLLLPWPDRSHRAIGLVSLRRDTRTLSTPGSAASAARASAWSWRAWPCWIIWRRQPSRAA